jgi:RND family efflux transporter MFP subunit
MSQMPCVKTSIPARPIRDAGRRQSARFAMKISAFSSEPARRRRAYLLLLTGVLVGAGCSRKSAPSAPAAKPVVVQLAPVAYSDAAVPVRASGVLSRKTEADLSFKISGVVEAVLVRAGDVVEKGQVLARLRLDEIEAQVTQARSAHEKAQRDLERVEKLHTSGAVASEALQDARTALEQAAATARIADFNRRFAVITAPSVGRILRRAAEPDELAGAGKPILGFASDADGWIVRAGLAERDVARVQLGDRVEVTGACTEDKVWPGRVTQISEAVEPLTRTTQVEVALTAPPCSARSGSVAAVTLFPQPVAARPVVPATALIEGAAGTASVFVVDEGASASRRVTVDVEALSDTRVFLRTALPRTARIVASGGEFLRDGAAIAAAR